MAARRRRPLRINFLAGVPPRGERMKSVRKRKNARQISRPAHRARTSRTSNRPSAGKRPAGKSRPIASARQALRDSSLRRSSSRRSGDHERRRRQATARPIRTGRDFAEALGAREPPARSPPIGATPAALHCQESSAGLGHRPRSDTSCRPTRKESSSEGGDRRPPEPGRTRRVPRPRPSAATAPAPRKAVRRCFTRTGKPGFRPEAPRPPDRRAPASVRRPARPCIRFPPR